MSFLTHFLRHLLLLLLNSGREMEEREYFSRVFPSEMARQTDLLVYLTEVDGRGVIDEIVKGQVLN